MATPLLTSIRFTRHEGVVEAGEAGVPVDVKENGIGG